MDDSAVGSTRPGSDTSRQVLLGTGASISENDGSYKYALLYQSIDATGTTAKKQRDLTGESAETSKQELYGNEDMLECWQGAIQTLIYAIDAKAGSVPIVKREDLLNEVMHSVTRAVVGADPALAGRAEAVALGRTEMDSLSEAGPGDRRGKTDVRSLRQILKEWPIDALASMHEADSRHHWLVDALGRAESGPVPSTAPGWTAKEDSVVWLIAPEVGTIQNMVEEAKGGG